MVTIKLSKNTMGNFDFNSRLSIYRCKHLVFLHIIIYTCTVQIASCNVRALKDKLKSVCVCACACACACVSVYVSVYVSVCVRVSVSVYVYVSVCVLKY